MNDLNNNSKEDSLKEEIEYIILGFALFSISTYLFLKISNNFIRLITLFSLIIFFAYLMSHIFKPLTKKVPSTCVINMNIFVWNFFLTVGFFYAFAGLTSNLSLFNLPLDIIFLGFAGGYLLNISYAVVLLLSKFKQWNAYFISSILVVSFFILSSFYLNTFRFFEFAVFLLVCSLSDYLKLKYLGVQIGELKYSNLFLNVSKMEAGGSNIILLFFLIFYWNLVEITNIGQTLYWFYSAVAQIFAALLGIVSMFTIMILTSSSFDLKSKDEMDNQKREVKQKIIAGLKGFVGIYVAIIILAILGIVIKLAPNIEIFNNNFSFNMLSNVDILHNLFSISIFELTLLMTPLALLYLHALILDLMELSSPKY